MEERRKIPITEEQLVPGFEFYFLSGLTEYKFLVYKVVGGTVHVYYINLNSKREEDLKNSKEDWYSSKREMVARGYLKRTTKEQIFSTVEQVFNG